MLKPRLKRNSKPIKIIRKQQRTNIRDFQRIITKVLHLPRIWKKTEIQNQRKTDVDYVTKVVRFQTKNISAPERGGTIKRKRLCFNCLSNTHEISNCKSKVTCKIKRCGKRCNTILHNVCYKPSSYNADSTADNKNKQQQERQQNQQDQQVINSHSRSTSNHLF